MITFSIEDYSKCAHEIDALFSDQDEEIIHEVCMYRDDETRILPKMHKKSYHMAENSGLLHIVIARNEDKKLIGYCSAFIYISMHYSIFVTSNIDTIYIHPSYREGLNGIKMLRYAAETLEKKGVDLITASVLPGKNMDIMFKRLKWKEMGKIYGIWAKKT